MMIQTKTKTIEFDASLGHHVWSILVWFNSCLAVSCKHLTAQHIKHFAFIWSHVSRKTKGELCYWLLFENGVVFLLFLCSQTYCPSNNQIDRGCISSITEIMCLLKHGLLHLFYEIFNIFDSRVMYKYLY